VGASPPALRLLSVVLGVAAIAVVRAVREAGGGDGALSSPRCCSPHPCRQQARNARMYALGVLLAP
jgi:hypothetical protein